jgi:hypothetical protein
MTYEESLQYRAALSVAQLELGLRWLHDRAQDGITIDLTELFETLGWQSVLRGFTTSLAFEYMQKLSEDAKSDPTLQAKMRKLSKRVRRQKG